MATKPNASDADYDLLSEWASGGIIEKPASDKITSGFSGSEKPLAKNFNWNWDFAFKWIKYCASLS